MKREEVKKKYDRFALFYDISEYPTEKFLFSKWRKKYLSKLKGNILEIGVGTGKNLEYYNKDAKVIGIDISQGMLEKAKQKANASNIKLKVMDAEHLKFKSNSFDYVISTCILCSVPDQVKALKEMRRVLKPKGRVIMIEHVLSKNKLIALFEKIHNPFTRFLFGFNINRDTQKSIKKAGLHIIKDENLALKDVFRLFIAKKGSGK
tara:strand:+ start:2719 stop:3336 length:618 start_codon:yes stop_codon:yes gene_type:complete